MTTEVMIRCATILSIVTGLSQGWQPSGSQKVSLGLLSSRATFLRDYRVLERADIKIGSPIMRSMALVPLPVEDLERLLLMGVPSGPQYATYWGRTKV